MSDIQKQIQDVLQDLKTPDLQPYRDRAQALKKKHEPRNLFNQWRNSEGRQWKVEQYAKTNGCCPHCKRHFTIGNLVIDHMKPIKDFPELAVNTQNLQLLCHDCNQKKGAKHTLL